MTSSPIAGDGASLSDSPTVRYTGRRTAAGIAEVTRHAADGRSYPLPLRLDLRNHSPSGVEWGYGGSGPAQLALAILADAIGPTEALSRYQRFKRDRIAKLDGDAWEITREQIQDWLAQQRGVER